MARKDRLRRDQAGIGPEPRAGLQPLKKTRGFRIARGEPDIRGWEVQTLNGRRVGQVDDLLVDVDAGDVVMMDVEMRGSERHLELPLRSAQLDREQKRVIVDSGDVDRYGGLADENANGIDDRLEPDRADRDLDRDGIPDRDERYRSRADRDLDRDDVADRDELRAREARLTRPTTRLERDELAPDMRADADEIVVERRPVVEEVVIRRRVVDQEE